MHFPMIPKIFVLVIPLIGYLALTSYTWPLGFLPIVAIESLPILLLGCFVYVIYLLVMTFILFLPLWVLLNYESFNRIFLNGNAVSSSKHHSKSFTPWNRPFKGCKTPAEKINRIVGITNFVIILIALTTLIMLAWYYIVSNPFSGKSWVDFIFFMVVFSFLSHSMNSSTGRPERILHSILLAIWLVTFPAIGGPNRIVSHALMNIRLGGDIPVTVTTKADKGIAAAYSGLLLFYDGNKAWIRPCDKESTPLIETRVESISYLASTPCEL